MIKNELLDITNEDQLEAELFLTLTDDSEWEYNRIAFGEDFNGIYVVDVDDSGETFRSKTYINDRYCMADVLCEGIDCGVLTYRDGTHYTRLDAAPELWDKWLNRLN